MLWLPCYRPAQQQRSKVRKFSLCEANDRHTARRSWPVHPLADQARPQPESRNRSIGGASLHRGAQPFALLVGIGLAGCLCECRDLVRILPQDGKGFQNCDPALYLTMQLSRIRRIAFCNLSLSASCNSSGMREALRMWLPRVAKTA